GRRVPSRPGELPWRPGSRSVRNDRPRCPHTPAAPSPRTSPSLPCQLLYRFLRALVLMATAGFAAVRAPASPFDPNPSPVPAPRDAGDAPAVCAAAATNTCAPVAPTADDSRAARVQRCQDWWNSLADAFTAHNRPDWAARASELAGRCDEFVTRWEQWEQTWQDWQARHPKDPKADHNGDGHADNGQGPKHDHPA